MVPVLIFGPSRGLVYAVHRGCAAIEDLCVYKIVHSYPSPNELIRYLNIFSPKLVFLELEGSDAPFSLAEAARHSHPETAIIGFAQQCSRERAVAAAELGIAEILIPPFDEEEFEQTVIQVLDALRSEPPDDLVAFMPAKAGSGATTAAVNVAGALARDWRRKVLLIDGDLRSGVLSLLLQSDPQKTLLNALEASQRLENEDCWEKLISASAGFDVLGAPLVSRPASFSNLCYHRFFHFVRSRYDSVIVDLPETPTELTMALAAQAKDFYLVSVPEETALFLVRRRVIELRNIGVPRARINVLVNRYGKADPPIEEVERVLERRIAGVFPNDEASVRGTQQDASIPGRSTTLGAAAVELAQVIAGADPVAKPILPPAPQSVMELLFGRKRATSAS